MDRFLSGERAVAFLAIVIVVGALAFNVFKPNVDSTTYQVIYLPGGQQFFGKLHALNTQTPYLNDVYYVSQKNPNTPLNQPQNFQLVKFGSELHGPQDVMFLNPANIIFWSNLRADSEVVKGIAKEKAQRAAQANQPAAATPPVTSPTALDASSTSPVTPSAPAATTPQAPAAASPLNSAK